jgi:hypothetical protein
MRSKTLRAMSPHMHLRQWRALPSPHARAKAVHSMPFPQRAHLMGQAMTDSLNSSVLSDQAAALPGQEGPLASAEGPTGDELSKLSPAGSPAGETTV